MRVNILFLLLSISLAQWTLLDKSDPPHLTTDPSAQPNSSSLSPMWYSSTGSLYLLNDRMWKYEIDGSRWIWMPEVDIGDRSAAAVWTIRGLFYIYGGTNDNGTMWTFDPISRHANQINSGSGPSAVGSSYWTHAQSNRLYLWSDGLLRAFDITTNTWSTITYSGNPEITPYASATYLDGNVYLYVNDRLWKMDLSTFAWTLAPQEGILSPPGPGRIKHTLWSIGDALYLYGGVSGSKIYGDTWRYVGSSGWTLITNKGSVTPVREGFASAKSENALFIFGGGISSSSSGTDLWAYGTITELTILERLENGLKSSIVWAFAACVTSGLILAILIMLIFFICVRSCIIRRKNARFAAPKQTDDFLQL